MIASILVLPDIGPALVAVLLGVALVVGALYLIGFLVSIR